jgi:hypothetical protein
MARIVQHMQVGQPDSQRNFLAHVMARIVQHMEVGQD